MKTHETVVLCTIYCAEFGAVPVQTQAQICAQLFLRLPQACSAPTGLPMLGVLPISRWSYWASQQLHYFSKAIGVLELIRVP